MAYPEILEADDHEAVRSLLGVVEIDVKDDLIDQLPYGPQAEATAIARLGDGYAAAMAIPAKALLIRMATTYMVAALLAETYVHGGMIGLVRGQATRDWKDTAATLWSRANATLTDLSAVSAAALSYDLTGLVIGQHSHHGHGRRWWAFPPVFGAEDMG